MGRKITLIKGDGIGPEVIDACLEVLDASGVKLSFEEVEAGGSVIEEKDTPLPDEVLESIRKNRVALKGPITTPIASGFRSVNVALRKKLNLYVNLRPIKSFKGVPSRYGDIDMIVVRENTEGLYSGVERHLGTDAAEAIRIITRHASERIARFAFEYATTEKRKKVTAVHKANILKYTDGIFLESVRRIATEYPNIEFDDFLVDNMCMQLVKNPERFDVLVLPNMFGDMVSDLCAGLVGGLGVVPGANIGENLAVFEPIHGSAPKHAGKNKVNPTSAILSGALMLGYLGETEAKEKIYRAVADVIQEGKYITYDLGGTAKTTEMTSAIAKRLEAF